MINFVSFVDSLLESISYFLSSDPCYYIVASIVLLFIIKFIILLTRGPYRDRL